MIPNFSQPLPVPGTDEIRKILEKRVDQQKQAVGIVVGIIEPNGRRVVAYGNFSKGDPRPVDGDTIFEIGSITKVFTSLLLADMVNRKEVALDDPAGDYLPEHVRMPKHGGKSITLIDLATHTSGLPRLPVNMKVESTANPYVNYKLDDLYQFLSGYTLTRDPGSEFEYSNLGAGLLGHLLASRAGTDFSSLIRSRITQPLGMPDTSISLSPSMKERMATGHDSMLAPTANWDSGALAGAGALRSSANDMLTFLEAFLGYKESPLATAMKAMLEVRRPMGNAKFEIGLAWQIFGGTAWHNGGTGGFTSVLICDTNARSGIVVLSNASAGVVDDIGFHLLNPKLPLANPEPPTERTEIHLDPKLLDNYTGRYQLKPNVIIEITRDGDRLFSRPVFVAQPGISTPKLELFAEGEKNFFHKEVNAHISFETGTDGRATGLVIHRPGRGEMTTASRLS